MVLRIFEIIATSGFLTALECTKFVFGRGSAPDPTGGVYSVPQTPSWLKGPYFKGMREKRERASERKKRGRAEEGKGRDRPPFRKFLDPHWCLFGQFVLCAI